MEISPSSLQGSNVTSTQIGAPAETVVPTVPDVSLSAIVDISKKSNFISRLENYLASYRKGKPDRSSTVPAELFGRDLNNNEKILENGGVKAFTTYNRYTTALNGYQKARYVAGVSEGTQILDKLS